MSKLVDLFVEWSRRKRRWPLLLILLVPVVFAFFSNFYNLTFRQVLENAAFLRLSVATIAVALGGFLVVNFGDYLRYSTALDLLRGGRRVTIARQLAWQRLTYQDDGEETSVTVVKEVARLVEGLGLRTVVVRQTPSQKVAVGPRDQFAIHGVVSPNGYLLRSVVLLEREQALRIVDRFTSAPKMEPGSNGSIPWHRIFAVQPSLKEMFLFELSVPASLSGTERTTLTRLFIRHALMVMLVRDQKNERAIEAARALTDLGALMPSKDHEQLARMFKAVAMNLIAEGDLQDGARALAVGRKFAPADPELMAADILCQLRLGQIDAMPPLLTALEAATQDRALVTWLRADHVMAAKEPDKAIGLLESAIALEPSEEHRTTLHFNAAFAYAMARTLNDRDQGDGMIRHLEDAIQLSDNPVFHVLKAYGWSLRGDQQRFDVECGTVDAQLELLSGAFRDRVAAFAETWKARGLRQLRQPSKAAEHALNVLAPDANSHDRATLMVLAGAELDMAGIVGTPEHLEKADRYIQRALESDASDGEAYKYRALINTLRAERATDGKERARFSNQAREDFLRSIRLGHELPASHAVLARLYDRSNDPVNAAKHRRRWLELTPSDPEARAYQALEIFDHDGDLATAKAHLDAVPHTSEEIGKVYRLLAAAGAAGTDAPSIDRQAMLRIAADCLRKAIVLGDRIAVTYDLLGSILVELSDDAGAIESLRQAAALEPDPQTFLTLGILHTRKRELVEAGDAYERALALDPSLSTAHNNFAYVLFDRGDFMKALEHWELALRATPDDPDVLAGRAAALNMTGRGDEGRASFEAAVTRNRDFLDESKLRSDYLWSDAAIAAVTHYIDELRNSLRDPSPRASA